MTRTNSPTQAIAAANGMAGRDGPPAPARLDAPGSPAIPDEREPEGRQHEQAVVPRQRRQPGEQPGQGEGPRRALEAAGAHPQRRRDERLVEREVVRLGHEGQRQDRDRDQDPGADRDRAARARRRGRSPRSAARRSRRSGRTAGPTPRRRRRRASRNGTWTSDASGIQWAFDGIGRTGSAGSAPPTSGKIQMKSTLNPSPAASARATST